MRNKANEEQPSNKQQLKETSQEMSSPQWEVQRLTVNEASDKVLFKTVNHRLRTIRGCMLSYSTHTGDYHLWNEGDDLCALEEVNVHVSALISF